MARSPAAEIDAAKPFGFDSIGSIDTRSIARRRIESIASAEHINCRRFSDHTRTAENTRHSPFRNLGDQNENSWSLSFLESLITELTKFKSLIIRPSSYVTKYLKADLQLSGWSLPLASGLPIFLGGIGCILGGLFTDRMVHVLGRRWGRTLQGVLAYAAGGCFFLIALELTETNSLLAFGFVCLASY